MADTMSIALVGALILTLTFVPVMCSYWFTQGRARAREQAVRVDARENTRRSSTGASIIRRPRLSWPLAIFGATLLLVPFIGGEFMPHLDEGALWVRATMPYTISYEEAAKFSPQVRNILMKYPMVTDVGSELGRPDDGTDSTGFFNDEFYVGLKPYNDSTWKKGRFTTRPN